MTSGRRWHHRQHGHQPPRPTGTPKLPAATQSRKPQAENNSMIALSSLLILTLQLPTDTIVVDAGRALRMAEEASLTVEAARLRVDRAAHGVAEARSWNAPRLEAVVENVGAMDGLPGSGMRAAEGQIVLSSRVRIGGDRGAGIALSRASRDVSAAEHELALSGVRTATLQALTHAERDRTLLQHAAEERVAMETFANALAAGAEAGRFAAGDAARAEGALVLAITEEARRRAALAGSDARLAYLLGLTTGTPLRILTDGICVRPDEAPEQPPPLASLRLAEARLAEADAAHALTRARAIPDLEPQIGVRRTAGVDGLYLGLAIDLPLLGGTRQRTAAARVEREAVAAEARALERSTVAERSSAALVLAALESAGAHFTEDWSAVLDLSVVAAVAGYELGEGTLGDLLQARQARVTALRDHAEWIADVRLARIEAARLGHLPLDERVLCTASL